MGASAGACKGHEHENRANAWHACTYSRLAHRGEAIEAIDTVLEEVHGSEEKIFLSDLTRLRGEFLMRYRGPDAEPEAEKEFQEALGFARK